MLFEAELSEYTYWGKGSSILLADAKNCYWITANHAMNNVGGAPENLAIFPTDYSTMSIPFNARYKINLDNVGDEEHKDIYLLRIDLSQFKEKGDAPLTAQDIEIGSIPAERLKAGDNLLVVGYPSEFRAVDYDEFKIKYKRYQLKAKYLGPSITDHCHELSIVDEIELNSYDGISGGPVYYMAERIPGVITPLFVGMTLRATAKSHRGHFVSANVILDAIKKAK